MIPAENAPNPEAEKVWLTQLLDPKVQSEFNLKKGSAPVTSDASLDGYPDYQQQAAKAFQTLTDRQLAGPRPGGAGEFANTYTDAVTSFLGSKNVDAFLKTMTEAQKNQLGSLTCGRCAGPLPPGARAHPANPSSEPEPEGPATNLWSPA